MAIKYTTALAVASWAHSSQDIGNNNIVVGKTEESSSEKIAPEKSASIRKNWISAEMNVLGGGLRYERMINAKLSLGATSYYQNFIMISLWEDFGVDLTARFYPLGKTFYIGAGLGYHIYSAFDYELRGHYEKYGNGDINYYRNEFYTHESGFAITPELGWKIDTGNPGGFFMDTGIKTPVTFGGKMGIDFSWVPYIGFGAAF